MTQNQFKSPESISASYLWATHPGSSAVPEIIAPTRDVFRARLDRFYREMSKASWPEADSALLTAVVGEIGNNCFDHNLGQWRDTSGCWFEWGFIPDKPISWILLADRGQGVLASLGRVDPSIRTDQQALDAAFSRILSGRSPEKRGNGLKFVKQIINGDSKRGLIFLSGGGRMVLGNLGPAAEACVSDFPEGKTVQGTWALIMGERS
jgi:hypothetical protein